MDRSQSLSADYKLVTRQFHFCLDKAAVLNDFPCSPFILDQTASIWCNEAYSCCLFFSPTPTKSYVLLSSSNEETVETAEKTITTTNGIANEAKTGNKSASDYSL